MSHGGRPLMFRVLRWLTATTEFPRSCARATSRSRNLALNGVSDPVGEVRLVSRRSAANRDRIPRPVQPHILVSLP